MSMKTSIDKNSQKIAYWYKPTYGKRKEERKKFLWAARTGLTGDKGQGKHLLRVGWRNFFSSCAVVSVFGTGGI